MNVRIVFEELPEEFLATSRYVPKELDDVTVRFDLGKLFEEANRDEDAFIELFVRTVIELFVRTDMHELLHPLIDWAAERDVDNDKANKVIERIEEWIEVDL